MRWSVRAKAFLHDHCTPSNLSGNGAVLLGMSLSSYLVPSKDQLADQQISLT